MSKINSNLIKLAQLTSDPKINQTKVDEDYQKLQLQEQELPGFIYIPSIEKYVAKETTHHNKTWYECHTLLHEQRQRMLSPHEFVEFLKFLKQSKETKHKKVLNNIIRIGRRRRVEWLDASFNKYKGKLYLFSHHESIDGELIPKEKSRLRGHYSYGNLIDFNDWLQRTTPEGLPPKNIRIDDKNFYYGPPRENFVAEFGAHFGGPWFSCLCKPSDSYPSLGVRPALSIK